MYAFYELLVALLCLLRVEFLLQFLEELVPISIQFRYGERPHTSSSSGEAIGAGIVRDSPRD